MSSTLLRMSTPLLRVAALGLLTFVAPPVAAQSSGTSSTPAPQQSGPQPKLPPGTEIALSGCLQQRPAVTGAPVGHESGAAAGMILTKATATQGRGAAPATGDKTTDSYLIAGARAQELSRYVGEIVEIAGTLDTDAASLAARTPPATGAPAKPAPVHTITATTFRSTGRSCQ
jgi:hypothetical protein